MTFGRAIRGAFRLEADVAYLNHGSFGAVPRPVLAEVASWRERMEAEPVRFFMREAPAALIQARMALARFLNAEPEGLGFVENATAGVNAILASIDWRAGDEIVTTSHVYNAVRNAARHWAGRFGARLIEAPVPFPVDGPDAVVGAIEAALGPHTRLLMVDHITSPTALVFPVDRLVALARRHGVPILVDGAHAPGMLPLDVRAVGADWYVGNCHKWLFGARGCAFVYAAAERRGALHPPVISHGYGQGMAREFDWVGTRDLAPWLALPAALSFVAEHGLDRIATHNRALIADATAMIEQRWGVQAGAPPAMRPFMAALPMPAAGPATPERAVALHDHLFDRYKIEVPVMAFAGTLWARISAQIYNERDDYRRLAEAAWPAA